MSVGFVVVSHSRALAEAAVDLARIMVHDEQPPVCIAAGTADGGFGTDATAIMTALEELRGPDGVAVFVDMGSAVLSAETAIDLTGVERVRIVAGPFVEGLTAGLVRAAIGGDLDDVVEAAEGSMQAKLEALGIEVPDAAAAPSGTDVQLVNSIGLHARPSARLAALASKFDAAVTVTHGGRHPVDARSTMSLMALGARQGDWLHIDAEGPEAETAVREVVAFIAGGFGETA